MAPDIDIFGLTIKEPMTTATDYLVTAVGWWLGAKLLRPGKPGGRSAALWGIGFLWIGLAALLGGTSHGFAVYLSDTGGFVIWKATVYAVGLSASFALAGSIAGAPLNQSSMRVMHTLNILAFIVYGTWMLNHSGFIYVIYHYVPVMTAIAILQAYACAKKWSPGALWIVAGVLVTMTGAAIQRSGFSLHIHFNHNDLYHLVQVVGLVFFYRGITRVTAQRSQDHGETTA